MINPDFEGERLKDKYQSPSPTGLPVEEKGDVPKGTATKKTGWRKIIRRVFRHTDKN